MKKIFALILALCIAFGAAAFATTIDEDSAVQSADTTIKTSIDEEYIVVIPAEVNVAFNAQETSFDIEVTKLRLGVERELKISLGSNTGKLVNAEDDKATIAYTLTEDDKTTTLSSYIFTRTGKVTSYVKITAAAWNAAVAGEYSNTITFRVAAQDQ